MEIQRIFQDNDADISIIKSRKVGIIGFGNQGKAQALNLCDSGVNVCIGVREGSASRKSAESDGLNCCSILETLECCDIISLFVPDQVMGELYSQRNLSMWLWLPPVELALNLENSTKLEKGFRDFLPSTRIILETPEN